MIIEVLVNMVSILLQTVLGLLPNIPQFPTSLTTALDNFSLYLAKGVNYLVMIFGWPFLWACAGLLVVILAFEQIYHGVMWVITKLPIGVKK